MNARKLRVVPDCPQPEPPPFKPIQYGFGGGRKVTRLAPMPTAEEISIRARAQSLLSKGGVRAELPDIETARRILADTHAVTDTARPATGDSSCPARGGVSAPRNYSTVEEWDAYYEGRAPEPEHPPF